MERIPGDQVRCAVTCMRPVRIVEVSTAEQSWGAVSGRVSVRIVMIRTAKEAVRAVADRSAIRIVMVHTAEQTGSTVTDQVSVLIVVVRAAEQAGNTRYSFRGHRGLLSVRVAFIISGIGIQSRVCALSKDISKKSPLSDSERKPGSLTITFITEALHDSEGLCGLTLCRVYCRNFDWLRKYGASGAEGRHGSGKTV